MKHIFLFPGQGSQKVGMARDYYEKFPVVRDRFSEACDIVKKDLTSIIFQGPEEELRLTSNTQPALFTVECAITDVIMQETAVRPSLTMGHSLGEYSALYAAGFFTFAEGVALVARRGQLMAEAGSAVKGAMAAVMGLSQQAIREVLATITGGVVVCANENAPDQIIISGDEPSVDRASKALTAAGAKRALKLPVSGAFHSPLMKPAADIFDRFLRDYTFKTPHCPVVSNVTALPVDDPAAIKELLVRQLLSPVRWIDSVEYLKNIQPADCIEIGPGNVLKGLVKKCNKELNVISCESVDNLYSLPH